MDRKEPKFEIVDPTSDEGIKVLASDAFRLAVEQVVAAEKQKRDKPDDQQKTDQPSS